MNKAFALPVIHSGNGSLEQYIHTVNSIPMLTAEEETQLAERQQKGDLNAAKQLILSHLRVVVSIARGYDGYGLNQADLIQEGNIGLMKAVKRYEPSRARACFRLPCIGLKPKSTNSFCATGVWSALPQPNRNANCSSTCAACVKT